MQPEDVAPYRITSRADKQGKKSTSIEYIHFNLKNMERLHITLNGEKSSFISLKLQEIQFNDRFNLMAEKWMEFVEEQQKLKILTIDTLLDLQQFRIEKISELEVI